MAPPVRMMRFGLALAALVAVLDQLSKWWIVAVVMAPPRIVPVTPFFNVVMVWNRGASFGLFATGSPWGPWLLSALAVAVSIALVMWLRKAEHRWLAAGIGLIVGGAVGNVIDRARFGAVIDFLDVFAGSYHWPAFNLADSAITVGAGILLFDALIGERRRLKLDANGQGSQKR